MAGSILLTGVCFLVHPTFVWVTAGRGLHHHATLCIAAYAFLLHQRLTRGSKKTLLGQKRLSYPKITSLAAAERAQRHVPDSIATLRFLIAARIAPRLQRCPCCGSVKRNL